VTYYALDGLVERGRSDPASALALGAFLDGIPEQLVLGVNLGLATVFGFAVATALSSLS
jgi:hypothetical protein